MADDPLDRCWCTGVTREQVIAAVRQHDLRTVEEIADRTGACSGCRTCRRDVERWLREARAG